MLHLPPWWRLMKKMWNLWLKYIEKSVHKRNKNSFWLWNQIGRWKTELILFYFLQIFSKWSQFYCRATATRILSTKFVANTCPNDTNPNLSNWNSNLIWLLKVFWFVGLAGEGNKHAIEYCASSLIASHQCVRSFVRCNSKNELNLFFFCHFLSALFRAELLFWLLISWLISISPQMIRIKQSSRVFTLLFRVTNSDNSHLCLCASFLVDKKKLNFSRN